MKRWVLYLLVALAVIVLVSPGIVGRLAERNLKHSITWAGRESDDFSVREETFERGWFTAVGRHRIELKEGALQSGLPGILAVVGEDPGTALVVETRIDHGLVPVTSITRDAGSLRPALASTVSTFTLDRGNGETLPLPGRLFSRIGLTGETVSRYQLQPGSHQQDGVDLQWNDADLHFAIDAAAATLRYEGTIGPLRLASANDIASTETVRFDGSKRKTAHGFSVGDLELEMAAMSFEGPAGSGGFGRLRLDAATELAGDRVSGNASLDLEALSIPGLGSADLGMDVTVEGVEARALGRIVDALDTARDVDDSRLALDPLNPGLQGELKAMLLAGGELRVDRFDLSLPQGNVTATIALRLPRSGSHPDEFSWGGLVLAATATAALSIPAGLMDTVKAGNPEAGTLIAMGILRRDGDAYLLKAEYAKGLVTVNGAPMPLPLNALTGFGNRP